MTPTGTRPTPIDQQAIDKNFVFPSDAETQSRVIRHVSGAVGEHGHVQRLPARFLNGFASKHERRADRVHRRGRSDCVAGISIEQNVDNESPGV